MRTKTVLRHYCDFCSKGGFKKPDMASHEATCTKNPKRACWLCESVAGGFNYMAIAIEMRKREDVHLAGNDEVEYDDLWDTNSKDAVNWLYDQVVGCPACVLSVLRQGKIMAFGVFDYKEAVIEWHKEKNREFQDLVG